MASLECWLGQTFKSQENSAFEILYFRRVEAKTFWKPYDTKIFESMFIYERYIIDSNQSSFNF